MISYSLGFHFSSLGDFHTDGCDIIVYTM